MCNGAHVVWGAQGLMMDPQGRVLCWQVECVLSFRMGLDVQRLCMACAVAAGSIALAQARHLARATHLVATSCDGKTNATTR